MIHCSLLHKEQVPICLHVYHVTWKSNGVKETGRSGCVGWGVGKQALSS